MDTIGNALNKIKVAGKRGFDKVDIPASKIMLKVIDLLKQEGYIRSYRVLKGMGLGSIRVYLGRVGSAPLMSVIKRVSKPGCRIYRKKSDVPTIRNGLGTVILTTSRGIVTDRQARELGVGGEVLCYIW